MFISTLNRAHDDLCLCSLAWSSVLRALLQACAISVFLSWVHFSFLVTFFWSIPMTSLWCHWPCSFFLDFVMARCWKYWDEALRWLMFKTKHGKGSWASSFFFLPHPTAGSRILDAAGCCAWPAARLWACRVSNLGFLWKEVASLDPAKVGLAQKYLFLLL